MGHAMVADLPIPSVAVISDAAVRHKMASCGLGAKVRDHRPQTIQASPLFVFKGDHAEEQEWLVTHQDVGLHVSARTWHESAKMQRKDLR